jgi:hypothetical protein
VGEWVAKWEYGWLSRGMGGYVGDGWLRGGVGG